MLTRPLLTTFVSTFIQKRCHSFIRSNAVRIFQIDYEAHPASYTIDTAALFLGIKQPKLEAHHLPPLLGWKISGAVSVSPFYALMASTWQNIAIDFM